MSGELATAGATCASALVTAMAADGWGSFRTWLRQWLRRNRPESESHLLQRIDDDREKLLERSAAQRERQAGKLETAWGVRLQDIADLDAEAAREMLHFAQAWMSRHRPAGDAAPRMVQQRAEARGRASVVQIGGDQYGDGTGRGR
ncbi:hypothetical protein [Streptomyces aidingensis]|uniref:Uncharacterized protein n=1 Tax=Streptomyces aidingensis TaxID=910347 RepID=A0A1I1TJE3_9ACTN|nr:hypothetical protein [Streptomyces aidingensis]SFD58645.1 hypothetical protein SAMN05421773_1207 [Streptomyces aidingensis]